MKKFSSVPATKLRVQRGWGAGLAREDDTDAGAGRTVADAAD
jgi:hypothetical protein